MSFLELEVNIAVREANDGPSKELHISIYIHLHTCVHVLTQIEYVRVRVNSCQAPAQSPTANIEV